MYYELLKAVANFRKAVLIFTNAYKQKVESCFDHFLTYLLYLLHLNWIKSIPSVFLGFSFLTKQLVDQSFCRLVIRATLEENILAVC